MRGYIKDAQGNKFEMHDLVDGYFIILLPNDSRNNWSRIKWMNLNFNMWSYKE